MRTQKLSSQYSVENRLGLDSTGRSLIAGLSVQIRNLLKAVALSTPFSYSLRTIKNDMDDFLTKVQVEEIYDEQQLQEIHEYYEWLNQQNGLKTRQSGREGLREDFDLWESEFESRLSVEEDVQS
jgi:hypothetical protein